MGGGRGKGGGGGGGEREAREREGRRRGSGRESVRGKLDEGGKECEGCWVHVERTSIIVL